MTEKGFENKKFLIVGGAGFVGSNLTIKILESYKSIEIIIVDNLLSSEINNLPLDPRLKFILGSIADDDILQKIPKDINFVFHLACFHGNQSSIYDPIADHANNNITSLKLFNYLSNFRNLEKVIYSAAGCAVAKKTSKEATATVEQADVSLFHDSPYSISKLVGEMYGNYFFKSKNLPFVKARFQNVYGPREILGAGQWRGTVNTIWRNVIPTFIWKALNKEKLPLDNGGEGTRDFIFVEDIVRGLIACALNGEAGEAYNLASGVETKIIDLAKKINFITNNPNGLLINPPRDWDNSGKRFGSTIKSQKMLNFSAKISIDEGLKRTIDWTLKNRKFIQEQINKHDYFVSKL